MAWKFRTSDGSIKLRTANRTVGSSPPSSPLDGDEWIYNGLTGVYWHFIYDSSETTYKWKYIGGGPAYALVNTFESTTSTTYAALTTAGPSITLDREGDYVIAVGAYERVNAVGPTAFMSYDVGATGASDNDCTKYDSAVVSTGCTTVFEQLKTAIPASSAIVSKYRTSANTASFSQRWIRITPKRVI